MGAAFCACGADPKDGYYTVFKVRVMYWKHSTLLYPQLNEIRERGILESANYLSCGWSVSDMFCLKFLLQFLSHPIETCYI